MTIYDAALRRKLRQKLGSRTMRRNGTKSHKRPKPRQKLSELVLQWAGEQASRINAKRLGRLRKLLTAPAPWERGAV